MITDDGNILKKQVSIISNHRESNSYMRTLSVARPSIRKDVLTVEDKHEGYLDK